MNDILLKITVLTLCIVMLLTGCLQRAGNSDTSDDAGAPNFNQIFGSGNGGTTNNNANNTGNNNNNNNNNNIGNNNADDSSDDGASDEGPKEYKPVSSGTWKQERFYLATCTHPYDYEGLKIIREAGFNLLEFGMAGDRNVTAGLEAAEKIEGLYTLPNNESRINQNNLVAFNDTSIRNIVHEYDKYKSIIGYNVWDELSITDFKRARTLKDLLDKWDPNSLKFVNMLPSYNDKYNWRDSTYENYLDTFIKEYKPQVISVDYYPYQQGTYGDGGEWWRDMGVFRSRSMTHNIPFWFYYQGTGVSQGKPVLDNVKITYQMFVGLAYNCKMLSEWVAPSECYFGNDLSQYTDEQLGRYNDAKARNNEIMAYGNYLFDKKSVKLSHTGTSDNYFRDFFTDRFAKFGVVTDAPDGLILSLLTDAKTNKDYLMVVNKNTGGGKSGTLTLSGTRNISKFNPETGEEDAVGSSNKIEISLHAGKGALYILN